MAVPKTTIWEAKFSLEHFKQSYNPLYIAVGKGSWSVLGFEKFQSRGIISLISAGAEHLKSSSSGNVFATVCQLDSALDSDCSEHADLGYGGCVTLVCSQEFLDNYKLNLEQQVYIKKIDVLPLDKIVIDCKNEQSFEWVKSQAFSVGLLCCVCQDRTLARRRDKLLAPLPPSFHDNPSRYFDLWRGVEIIDCSPYDQGYITVKTEILITSRFTREVTDITEYPTLTNAAIVSDFINGIKLDSLDVQDSLLELDIRSAENHLHMAVPYTIQHQMCSSNSDPLADQNVIFVPQCLATKFGLFNDSLVNVRLSDSPEGSKDTQLKQINDHNSKSAIAIANWKKHARNGSIIEGKPKKSLWSRCHVAKVQISKETFRLAGDQAEGSQISISPVAFFHISKQQRYSKDQRLLIQKYQSIRHDKTLSASASWYSELPFATEIHISVVFGPGYSSGASYNQAIEFFFQSSRIVKKGDVLCIPTKADCDFHQDLSDSTSNRQPVVYFLVKKIVPKLKNQKSYLVDTRHTNLFQEGNDHSYVPSLMETWMSCTSNISPVGLEDCIDKVSSIFQPHIMDRTSCKELTPSVLLTGPAGCGKTLVCKYVAGSLHLHLFIINCFELNGETSAATEARIKHQFQRACTYAPCLLLLKNVQVIGKERDGSSEDSRVAEKFHRTVENLSGEISGWPIVIVATSPSPRLLTADVHEGFLHHVEIKIPNEVTRKRMISAALASIRCAADVSVKHIAQRTAGMVLGDLNTLVAQAKRFAYRNVTDLCNHGKYSTSMSDEKDIQMAGLTLQQSDITSALDQMQAAHSDAIGAPKIPNVTWDDVGGLAQVKAEILDTIQLPLQHPELLSAGLRRSGVLLYGPPGTGKTLLAKAVATECSLNFLSVKGPELINMYVGQSEENIREVFSRARSASPCVIFFDELDSLAPNRGRSGDSGGVMDRVVSQLLAELDGLHKSCDIFVIGATNRPDLLDPALLRPGRFDKLLYLGVSEDKESQFNIVKALTRKFCLESGCCLQNVVSKCPYNMTGADFYALCSDAMLNSMKKRIALLDAGRTSDNFELEVSEDDFLGALANLVPSVSEAELNHYKALQSQFTYQT